MSALIPATPDAIFDAWLDSRGHSEMTGSPAIASREAGAEFQAWDGYIRGRNGVLERPGRIVQSWRTSNFDAADPDSEIEVLLEQKNGSTQVTIRHSALPDHGSRYESGWVEHYFEPMRAYLAAKLGVPPEKIWRLGGPGCAASTRVGGSQHRRLLAGPVGAMQRGGRRHHREWPATFERRRDGRERTNHQGVHRSVVASRSGGARRLLR